MITYGPAINPAACHRKTGHVGSPGLLRGGAIIRIPVLLEEKTLWLDFEVQDRDALHQLATDILKALAEPMGGA